jgi:hypothetical protein
VFSLWIRRRDTHAENTDCVGDVPVFFDPGVAFDGEEGYEDSGRFFDPTEVAVTQVAGALGSFSPVLLLMF